MPKKLTELDVKKAVFDKQSGRQLWFDTEVKGLMLRTTHKGPVFALKRDVWRDRQKRTVVVTIGKVTLAEARAKARALTNVMTVGVNPNAKPPPPKDKAATLKRVWDEHLEWRREHNRPATVENHVVAWHYFQDWADRPIAELTAEDLRLRLASIVKASSANFAMKQLRETWNWFGELGPFPLSVRKWKRKTPKPKKKGMTTDELRAWSKAIERQPKRLLMLFELYTGLRRRTVLALRWEWISDNYIAFPADWMKSDREFRMPLSAAASAVLKQVSLTKDPFVFPWRGHRPTRSSKDVAYGHALRHTYNSHAVALGVPIAFVKALMDHKLDGLLDVYGNPAVLAEVLQPHQEAIGKHLSQLVVA